MATILLRVQKETRREALARVLGEEHNIVVSGPSSTEESGGEDVLILGYTTLQKSGVEAVRSYKTRDSRPESPVLLLVPSTHTSSLGSRIWKLVDEVVEIPVQASVMKNRVDNLIRLQEHANEVDTYRHLTAKYKVMLDEQQKQLSGYKALFKTQGTGALVMKEWDIVVANDQAEKLFGTENLEGRTLMSLFPSPVPDNQNPKETVNDLLELSEEETMRVEWTCEKSGGEIFVASVVLRSVQFQGETCVQLLFSEIGTGKETNPMQNRESPGV